MSVETVEKVELYQVLVEKVKTYRFLAMSNSTHETTTLTWKAMISESPTDDDNCRYNQYVTKKSL